MHTMLVVAVILCLAAILLTLTAETRAPRARHRPERKEADIIPIWAAHELRRKRAESSRSKGRIPGRP